MKKKGGDGKVIKGEKCSVDLLINVTLFLYSTYIGGICRSACKFQPGALHSLISVH